MVTHLTKLGGLQCEEDFANYTGKYIEPIKSNYRDYSVIECPPNGQGIVALAGLNILSNFNMGDLPPDSAERLHLEIEATRIAYRDRSQFLGDPDYNELPIDHWLDKNTGKLYAEQINRKKRSIQVPGQLLVNHQDTVYLTVVDKDRNAVSLINSLFKSFGSGLTAPRSGIILHSRGEGFTLKPDHPNTVGPNKRPVHTIIPGLLEKNGQIVMSFGVMGGQYQACGHMHLLSNLLDYGMDLQEAIDFPRIFPDFEDRDQRVQIEPGFGEKTLAGLREMGHNLYVPEAPIGGAQAIWIDQANNVLKGASDPRKDGMASGY
jgi:gamma-glutamyltranspeptidase/glutathione hydrolase